MENPTRDRKMQRSVERVASLTAQGADNDYAHLTPGERIGVMWQLAVDAWAFLGEDVAESRLQRHVEGVVRGPR
jgi:hypothetical protein